MAEYTEQCSAPLKDSVQCSAVQCSAVQCSVQCSAVFITVATLAELQDWRITAGAGGGRKETDSYLL